MLWSEVHKGVEATVSDFTSYLHNNDSKFYLVFIWFLSLVSLWFLFFTIVIVCFAELLPRVSFIHCGSMLHLIGMLDAVKFEIKHLNYNTIPDPRFINTLYTNTLEFPLL